jgi:hypothetical protein
MAKQIFTSWGRILHAKQDVVSLSSRFDLLQPIDFKCFLAYGNGRSYGDSCLNNGGIALKTRHLDRFIDFDCNTGVLSCEAGVLLSEVLDLVVPHGWFLPVTPGTRFVTIGGAISNDVHGKNHHVAGTFGCYVRKFELLRSDGQRLICTGSHNTDYFTATIGGLGLTGLITYAEIQLRRIYNSWIEMETIRYQSLDEFFELCYKSDLNYEYTVSWVDSICSGRGIFMRGNHATSPNTMIDKCDTKTIKFPFIPPISMVNSFTSKAFDFAYYHKQLKKSTRKFCHYEPFFYPLDNILEWNRMYGTKGFYQYQCVLPTQYGQEAIAEILHQIAKSGICSFLSILKICGNISSPGMLSFPLPGVSFAVDFPNQGDHLHKLFCSLDRIVAIAEGRLYPAKDSRMPSSLFCDSYPRLQEFTNYIDPYFSSSFWRRMMKT